ncbi:cystathionine gamma-lyase isoform X1 [Daphnia magna]|uniref:cystathionine gamma-lyase isoform X1 n=1 Tax=Daphnia magna TaxID=35525 RepID=UPI001E1BA247|nr:cystathionine gamma-lyase isoform X1 [Daphnia magna]
MDLARQTWRMLKIGKKFANFSKFRLITTTSTYGFREQDPSFATKIIHVAQEPEQWSDGNPIVMPISLSTTFKQEAPGKFVSCEYSRLDNPTRNTVERIVASLEGAKYGLAYSSGMAAITTVFNLLSPGDHIVSSTDLYGGTSIYLKQVADRLNIKTTFVDVTDPANIEKAINENTRLVWMETPSNPGLNLVDIEKVAAIVRSKNNVLLAIDNTFLSPYFQRPFEFGVDIVVHSATKYLNGHSDVLMGILLTNDDQLHDRLRFLQRTIGAVPSPFECYLLNRGMKTLPVRMRQHMENGLAVARFLENHPSIERVLHPGLSSHPQHELAKRQSYGHSGMITFFLKGGKPECRAFVKRLKVIILGESLGGYESLVKIPALMPESYQLGVPVNLIRLSVGLEYVGDLIADLDQALKAAVRCNVD